MKKSRILCLVIAVLILAAVAVAGFTIHSERAADISGRLTFDLSDGGVCVYNTNNKEIQKIKINGYSDLENITGYNPNEDKVYCTGLQGDKFCVIEAVNGIAVNSWELSEKPIEIRAVKTEIIVVLSDSVLSINSENGRMNTELRNVTVSHCFAYENNFVLWGDDYHYVGKVGGDKIIIGAQSQHDSSFEPLCMTSDEILLIAKDSPLQICTLDLMTGGVERANYNMGDTYPVAALGNNIICFYESNYMPQCKFYLYQADKDRLLLLDFPDELLTAKNFEWVE